MNSSNSNWNIHKRDVWLWLLISLLIYIVFSSVIPVFLKSFFPELSFVFFGYIGVILSLLFPIIHFSYSYDPISFSEFIPRTSDIPALLIAVIIVFISMSLAVISGGWKNERIVELRNAGALYVYLGLFISILLGPILEEILWRKYIFEILRHTFPTFVAVTITVTIETAFHFGYFKLGIKPFIFIFFNLLFFTIVYLKSNLRVSIAAHCLVNFFILTIGR